MKKVLIILFSFALIITCGCPPKNPNTVTDEEMTEMLMKELGPVMVDNGIEFHGISEDPSYGYEDTNPVKVGSIPDEYHYMDALRGPKLKYERLGSFENPVTGGILDGWQIEHKGISKPVVIYLDPYALDSPLAPSGFSYVE
jgi:hypothetical protein